MDKRQEELDLLMLKIESGDYSEEESQRAFELTTVLLTEAIERWDKALNEKNDSEEKT